MFVNVKSLIERNESQQNSVNKYDQQAQCRELNPLILSYVKVTCFSSFKMVLWNHYWARIDDHDTIVHLQG